MAKAVKEEEEVPEEEDVTAVNEEEEYGRWDEGEEEVTVVKDEVVDEDADLLEAATQAGDQEAIRILTEAKQALRDSQARELEADQGLAKATAALAELEAPEMKTEIADEAELLLAAEQVDLAYSPCSKWRADAVEGDIEDAEEYDYLM